MLELKPPKYYPIIKRTALQRTKIRLLTPVKVAIAFLLPYAVVFFSLLTLYAYAEHFDLWWLLLAKVVLSIVSIGFLGLLWVMGVCISEFTPEGQGCRKEGE